MDNNSSSRHIKGDNVSQVVIVLDREASITDLDRFHNDFTAFAKSKGWNWMVLEVRVE